MILEFPSDLEVDYSPSFYSNEDATALFDLLRKEIEWSQQSIWMFGKRLLEPRLIAFYGEKSYTYSGKLMNPLPWNLHLLDIKNKIEQYSKCDFNSALINLYRNGQDSMGWHSDDEKELGKNPVIASLSLGESRKFQFRQNVNFEEKHDIFLQNGSLLLMKGSTQHHWQHRVPKSTKVQSERINLTFRNLIY